MQARHKISSLLGKKLKRGTYLCMRDAGHRVLMQARYNLIWFVRREAGDHRNWCFTGVEANTMHVCYDGRHKKTNITLYCSQKT